MCKLIILAFVVCTAGIANAEPVPNWGISLSVPNSAIILTGSNYIASGVTLINNALGTLSSSSSNENVTIAANTLINMVKTLGTLNNAIRTSIIAANTNTQSVGATFGAINASVTGLSTYLESTAMEVVTNLTTYLGGSNVASVNSTLVAMNTAVIALTASLAAMETAINTTVSTAGGSALTAKMVLNGIPTSLATAVNNNLNLLKNSLSDMATPIKAIASGITASTAFYQTAVTTNQTVATTITTSGSTIKTLMSSLKLSVTNYANAAAQTMKTDWTSVTTKLAVFSTNSTLKAYLTNYTTFVTKTSKDYFTTFVGTATNTTNGVVTNLTEMIIADINEYYTNVTAIAISELGQLIPKIAAGSTVCNTNASTNYLSLFTSIATAPSTCITTATTMLNLAIAQFNNALQVPVTLNNFYTTAIASCSKYTTFANDNIAFSEALACLMSTSIGQTQLPTILTKGVTDALSYLVALADSTSLIEGTIANCYGFQTAQLSAGFTALGTAIAAC
ncbi:uncharacterized protein LOC129732428 [Wyeomyia smithii]|uniref:uncharacterized protein LOC129732428 n=1 Tax=Wyeomyia smithii TaxID=174621 RepID=UPI002467DD9B|nr:uncharacterized protein LOC129732428 [Wyeomyia smithii]